MKRKLCAIPTCSYPEGECYGTCFQPDEIRMDLIGQNGNTGEHYHGSPQIGSGDDLTDEPMSGGGYVAFAVWKAKEGQQ
jgi:hypothetical protein